MPLNYGMEPQKAAWLLLPEGWLLYGNCPESDLIAVWELARKQPK